MKTPAIISASAAAIVAGAIVFSACKKEPVQPANNYSATPVLPSQPYGYMGNSDIATLGRVLFYDAKLSLNNSVSCGSCHKQAFSFADNKAASMGLEDVPTRRNVSTIIANQNSKFWDGRALDYNDAVLQPVQNHAEMKIYDFKVLTDKLSQVSYYPDLFTKAYGSPDITPEGIRSALAAFLDNFTPTHSKYDMSIANGQPLTGLEEEGRILFTGSRAMCSQCHSSQSFSGWQGGWENIGLDASPVDKGVGAITKQSSDDGKFVIPSLKNIEFSAPYMHDGRFKTLRDVIDHYSEGIQPTPNLSWAFRDFTGLADPVTGNLLPGINPDQVDVSSLPAKSLHFTEHEKQALEAFLKTLSDPQFLSDVRLSDPFRKH